MQDDYKMMEDFQSRKRPRSLSPVIGVSNHKKYPFPTGQEFAEQLKHPRHRNHALNELMRLTAAHELSFALDGEDALKALVDIFFNMVGWEGDRPSASTAKPVLTSEEAWTSHVTPENEKWAYFCSVQLGKGKLGNETLKVLEVILLILRNMSFVAANHRLMAYSPDVITVLVGALYETTSNNVGTSDDTAVNNNLAAIATHAMHALVNIAQYLDVTGQKLLCDKLFLVEGTSDEAPLIPDGSTFGQVADGKFGFGSILLAKRLDTKEDFVADISTEMILDLTGPYLFSVWSVFPAVNKVFSDTTSPRSLIMMAEEFLQEFLAHTRTGVLVHVDDQGKPVPDARTIMINTPSSVLQRLVDMLYVPRLVWESLEYVDPTICTVTRVNTLRLLLGYDATVDTDVRDRALDVLVPLMELDSPRMAERLATGKKQKIQNRLLDALMPILTTRAGRTEAPNLALSLLKELSKGNMNRLASVYIRERLVALAANEAKIAHMALNFLMPDED
jgi:hypothetical protein